MAVLTGFVLNPPGVERMLGIVLANKAERVYTRASYNASGSLILPDTGDLRGGIRAAVFHGLEGPEAKIGTNASNDRPDKDGRQYPAFVTRRGGIPGDWLIDALHDEFPLG